MNEWIFYRKYQLIPDKILPLAQEDIFVHVEREDKKNQTA